MVCDGWYRAHEFRYVDEVAGLIRLTSEGPLNLAWALASSFSGGAAVVVVAFLVDSFVERSVHRR
ncbi:hypothetical protein A2U01_0097243, partial [Trifolium medium]|nr:hypothetical protein [Trifolium medium]